ncbi:MAG: NAD(P)-binding protein [Pseudonocardiaceae bacterium]
MTEQLHVIVVGGGIGGLCLAQGLRRAGVSVAVYERDASPTDRLEGYRIHLNPAGSRALKACLPPPVWDCFVATAGQPGGLGFLTEQLSELVVIDGDTMADPAEGSHAVDRITLPASAAVRPRGHGALRQNLHPLRTVRRQGHRILRRR